MARKHIVLFPSGQGVDFFRAERSFDGVYLRSGQASWLPILLPSILAQIDAISFVFSSFREVPLCDPAMLPLPSGQGYSVKILAPCGGYFPHCYGSLLFHSENRPPAVAGERFIPDNGGIKRQVKEFFSEDFIDLMRKPDRPRVELWVRPDLEIESMLPDAYDAPNWLKQTFGLPADQAAQKMAALRCSDQSAGAYAAKRRKDREAREREADAEEERAFAERQAAWLEEQTALRQYTDQLAGTHATAQDAREAAKAIAADQLLRAMEAPAAAPVVELSAAEPDNPQPTEPQLSVRELHAAGKAKRDKARRATQSKVQADKFNKQAAEAFAEKRLKQMTAQGKL